MSTALEMPSRLRYEHMGNKHLFNDNGSTITTTLIAAFILATVALGFASVFKDAFKFTSQVQRTVDITQKLLDFSSILSSSFSCSSSLVGLPLQTGVDLVVKAPAGSTTFLAKGKDTIKGVEITKVYWSAVNVDPTNPELVIGSLKVDFTLPAPQGPQSKEFTVFVKRNVATNRVASCVANDSYVRGGVYGNCQLTFNQYFKVTKRSAPIWPVTVCDEKVKCASGFSPTSVSVNQGNTTPSGTPHGLNDIYWRVDACVKN